MAELVFVVGARPNFVKAAPVVREAASRGIDSMLVHTGQHYDAGLSDAFFEDLDLPAPDVFCGVGSGTHAVQTAGVMTALEPVISAHRTGTVVVFGDVNSTLAAALVAAKLQVPVAHVESGLRSGDRSMPEEINRVVTDHVAELLFTTEESGNVNLAREGIPAERVHFVGNTMIDSLLAALPAARARRDDVLGRLGVRAGQYAALTLHRPSNVDDPARLSGLLEALSSIGGQVPVVFPVHPRTARNLPGDVPGVVVCQPMAYLDFLALMDASRLVLTDSGGIQEETTALGVACLTLRDNTERPVTITAGTNRLVGTDPRMVVQAAREVLEDSTAQAPARPPLWDGKAAGRVVEVLARGR